MKKLIISTLAIMVAVPAFANPERTDDWQVFGLAPYVGLRGGLGYTNLNYQHNGSKESLSDTVFQGRVAAGLEVCKTMRSEIEWSLYGKVKDSHTFGTGEDVNINAKTQTLLWNTYWEFSKYETIRPFAGIGIGAAFTDVSRHGPAGESSSADKTRFSAMGSMGLTFDMKRVAVDVAARYNYIDVASGLHNFGGDIGIRFMF